MSLCPLANYSRPLQPLAAWCLDTFGEGPPMLVGVAFGDSTVHFQPIELWPDDPVEDLGGLVAPTDWHALVVIAPTTATYRRSPGGTIAHAVDRSGSSATVLDDACGHRRTLRTIRGALHDRCLDVLGFR